MLDAESLGAISADDGGWDIAAMLACVRGALLEVLEGMDMMEA